MNSPYPENSGQSTMGYSIFTPYRGMEVKFQGVLQKEFLGGQKFLNMLFWGVRAIQTDIFKGLMHLDRDFQGDCRNFLLFAHMLSSFPRGSSVQSAVSEGVAHN